MRIWIARPEPGATRTALRLTDLGHDPLVAPVLAMAATGDAMPAGPFDGVLVTSANAVAALSAWAPCRDGVAVPVFCVGSRTAWAAREAGLPQIRNARGDAAALARLVQRTLPAGGRLLHLAGADRKAEPAASLIAAGYAVTVHVAYAMNAVPRLPIPVAQALGDTGGRALHAALHYSRRSAETALALAISAGCGGAFRALTHYCLSADVAAPLVAAGSITHFVAAQPSEESILARLSALT
jgi:uroporphyrinogen-III synthase